MHKLSTMTLAVLVALTFTLGGVASVAASDNCKAGCQIAYKKCSKGCGDDNLDCKLDCSDAKDDCIQNCGD